MKITACAFTIALLEGLPTHFPLFLHFMMVLAIFMVAAPGVPGGAIMAALAPLGRHLRLWRKRTSTDDSPLYRYG